jgi:hypothetical protein
MGERRVAGLVATADPTDRPASGEDGDKPAEPPADVAPPTGVVPAVPPPPPSSNEALRERQLQWFRERDRRAAAVAARERAPP